MPETCTERIHSSSTTTGDALRLGRVFVFPTTPTLTWNDMYPALSACHAVPPISWGNHVNVARMTHSIRSVSIDVYEMPGFLQYGHGRLRCHEGGRGSQRLACWLAGRLLAAVQTVRNWDDQVSHCYGVRVFRKCDDTAPLGQLCCHVSTQ